MEGDANLLSAALSETATILGLGSDAEGFYSFASSDPVLSRLITSFRGLRISGAPDGFEMLVSAICAQQVNLSFAEAVRSNFVRRFGVVHEDRYAFPLPGDVASAHDREFVNLQLSSRKISYLKTVADAYQRGWFERSQLGCGSYADAIDHLRQIPGVGAWTADWFLLRVAGRLDVCPISDLVVRKAISALFDTPKPEAIAASWGQHASYATEYSIVAFRHRSAAGL